MTDPTPSELGMVERVARAIDPYIWVALDRGAIQLDRVESAREESFSRARAAIGAMIDLPNVSRTVDDLARRLAAYEAEQTPDTWLELIQDAPEQYRQMILMLRFSKDVIRQASERERRAREAVGTVALTTTPYLTPL